MKKASIVFTAIMLSAIFSFAQKRIYIQAGMNYSKGSLDNEARDYTIKSLQRYHAGIMARVFRSKIINVETGLMVSGKGAHINYVSTRSGGYIHYTVDPTYIEIPVNINKTFRLDRLTKLILDVGPYAAIGITGRAKKVSSFPSFPPNPPPLDESIIFTDSKTAGVVANPYRRQHRMDYGINLGMGMQVWKVFLKASYGIGLRDIFVDNNFNAVHSNRVGMISLGYVLSKQ